MAARPQRHARAIVGNIILMNSGWSASSEFVSSYRKLPNVSVLDVGSGELQAQKYYWQCGFELNERMAPLFSTVEYKMGEGPESMIGVAITATYILELTRT